MRVRRERAGRPDLQRRGAARARAETRATAFRDELRLRELEREQAAEKALADLDQAAERLRKEPGLETLAAYKQALRAAIEDALRRAYRVQAETGFSGGGRRRLLYVVRVVDQKLEELTRLLLARERDNLAIAARLDEIRGLLLDLYR
ncbi:MAG: YaaR family protein [Limnochordales bacterium]